MTATFPQAVTIYGTGLMGGSFALALKKHFPQARVFGIDTPETIERAHRMGIIDNGGMIEAGEADLIILAAPVRSILELIETLPPQQLILDVGSTKVQICRKAELQGLWFLGGHPMTGTERSGPEAASANLFAGAPFFLCPVQTTPEGAVDKIDALVRTIGAKSVVMPAADHDRIVAQISHLPQLLSTLLADHTSGNLQFAGPGVRSMTRLAASPFHVWRDIFETSGPLPQELEVFVERLRSVLEALQAGDLEAIQTVFERVNHFYRRVFVNKVVRDAMAAIEDIQDGASIMMGGFGLCGIPENLISAIREKGVKDLTIVSNNAGVDDFGIGLLLERRQVRKMISTYVGENHRFEKLVLSGELDVELVPQGTFAERIRAAGAGIPAFYTPTGYGTLIAEGKETRDFDGRMYVMERALQADFAFVKAWKGDRLGNLVYRKTARNFNPVMATAGRTTIAEVEQLVKPGELEPDQVHTPAVFVQRILQGERYEKRIEKRTVRKAVGQ